MNSIAKDVKKGVKWSIIGQFSAQIIALASNVVLSRLVLPEYFGLIATLAIFLGLLKVVTNFGLGLSIIRKKRITRTYLNTGFWINFCFDLILGLLLFLAADIFANFYNDSRLIILCYVFAFTFFLSGIGMIPTTMLNKQLKFKQLAIIQITNSLLSSCLAILTALAGYMAWALVIQVVSAALLGGVLPYIFYKWIPQINFSKSDAKDYFSFGSPLLGDSILNYAVRNLDSFLIGKFIGITPLAYYNKSYQIMMLPVSQISGTLKNVFYPVLSKQKNSEDSFVETYLNLIKLIAFVTFPLMIGVSICSQELILILFGDNWNDAIMPLQILSILGAIQPIASIAGLAYLLKSRTKLMFKVGLVSKTLMISGIIIGLKWGLIGVCLGYLISSLFAVVIEFYFTAKIINKSLYVFVRQLFEPFIATLFMVLVINGSLFFIQPNNIVLLLVVKFLIGVFSYLFILITVFNEYYQLIKNQIFGKSKYNK